MTKLQLAFMVLIHSGNDRCFLYSSLIGSAMTKRQAGRKTTWRSSLRRWLLVGGLLVFMLPIFVIHRLAMWIDPWLFPQLREVDVHRPLFIVGPPRSGTTLAHRMLAENDQQFTTFPLWELLFAPALCEKILFRFVQRIDRAVGQPLRRSVMWLEQKLVGSMEGVHQTSLFLPEEDYLGLLAFGGCFLAVLVFPKSDWVWRLGNFSEELPAERQAKLLASYKGLLQRHLYFRGTDRAVLSKNPTFSAWIPGLLATFPDARFIGLLRNPKEIVPSQLSSVRDGIAFFGNDVSDPEIRDAFVRLLAGYYRQVAEGLSGLATSQAAIVEYTQLKTCSDQVVLNCLSNFGYGIPDHYRDSLQKQASNRSGYKSGHRYTLEDFGLTAADIDCAFGAADSAVKGS